MVQAPPILPSIQELRQLLAAENAVFFPEWRQNVPQLSRLEKQTLDHLKKRYLDFVDQAPMTEGLIQVTLVLPMLELLGFDEAPHWQSYRSIPLEGDDCSLTGSIEVMGFYETFWIALIEGRDQGLEFSQAVASLLEELMIRATAIAPLFAMMTNGKIYCFIKVDFQRKCYACSELFEISARRTNELQSVARIIKRFVKLSRRNTR